MTLSLSQYCLRLASNFRTGLALPYQEIESLFSDVDGFYNVAVPFGKRQGEKQAANGGIARTPDDAIDAGIAESLERYSGSIASFPVYKASSLINANVLSLDQFALFSDEQYNSPEFHYKKPKDDEVWYGEVFSLKDNSPAWVPESLIGLGSQKGHGFFPSTSTGLAAGKNKEQALLRGLEEVLERDALTSYWLSSLPGREVALGENYNDLVKEHGGEVYCFDITQSWSPCPVVVVVGTLPLRGVKRISLGASCRTQKSDAIEKAFAEWVQGVVFAGYYTQRNPDTKKIVSTFEDHAAYYTYHPDKWGMTPLMRGCDGVASLQEKKHITSHHISLLEIVRELEKAGLHVYYRDITPVDVRETGVTVVRVIVPGLAYLHGDEQSPFLGGRTGDIAWRYGDIKPIGPFPNTYPHPLG